MVKIFVGVFLVTLFMSACRYDMNSVPIGEYYTNSKDEWLKIAKEIIHVHMYLKYKGEKILLDKKFDYKLLKDGKIHFSPLTSAEAVFGIGQFKWYWEKDKIVQINRVKEKKLFFLNP